MLTNDLHVMSLNICDLRSNYLNLFQCLTADISVVECGWGSVYDFYETEQSKTLTVRFVGIFAAGLLSGRYYNAGGTSNINASLDCVFLA